MNLELWTKNEGLRAKNEGLFAVSDEVTESPRLWVYESVSTVNSQ